MVSVYLRVMDCAIMESASVDVDACERVAV